MMHIVSNHFFENVGVLVKSILAVLYLKVDSKSNFCCETFFNSKLSKLSTHDGFLDFKSYYVYSLHVIDEY